MPVRYLKKHAALEGHVSVEDAEALAQWLRGHPNPAVHLGKCEQVHAAVLQVLLALRPKLLAPPAHGWLAAALQTDSAQV
jgi:hypothetical protein